MNMNYFLTIVPKSKVEVMHIERDRSQPNEGKAQIHQYGPFLPSPVVKFTNEDAFCFLIETGCQPSSSPRLVKSELDKLT